MVTCMRTEAHGDRPRSSAPRFLVPPPHLPTPQRHTQKPSTTVTPCLWSEVDLPSHPPSSCTCVASMRSNHTQPSWMQNARHLIAADGAQPAPVRTAPYRIALTTTPEGSSGVERGLQGWEGHRRWHVARALAEKALGQLAQPRMDGLMGDVDPPVAKRIVQHLAEVEHRFVRHIPEEKGCEVEDDHGPPDEPAVVGRHRVGADMALRVHLVRGGPGLRAHARAAEHQIELSRLPEAHQEDVDAHQHPDQRGVWVGDVSVEGAHQVIGLRPHARHRIRTPLELRLCGLARVVCALYSK
mmetsp:Transcript_15483/g.34666  ORF Transcript_15483/g.34666 Transcript_15483/m.34666 type:complete len:298 (+) Transcript_15483:299-1192(+)